MNPTKKKFEKDYWETLYVEDENSVIDGVYNSRLHALYAKSLFDLVDFPVKRLCDIGFGLGFMLRDFCKVFKPEFVIGLEPSEYCIQKLQKQNWYKKYNLAIIQTTFQNWKTKFFKTVPFDLVIINSVIQYFPTSSLENDIYKLSEIGKFIYITLPTSEDYALMKQELDFADPFAYSRKAKAYKKMFSKYFYFVSCNVLESKYHHKTKSPFSYELFRF